MHFLRYILPCAAILVSGGFCLADQAQLGRVEQFLRFAMAVTGEIVIISSNLNKTEQDAAANP
jgi:hypothetical protein